MVYAAAAYVYVAVTACILVYAVLKERQEAGCYRLSVGRQCMDEQSVHVIGTKLEPGDDVPTIVARLKSALSFHEKSGVWRRCYIIGTVLTLVVLLALWTSTCNPKQQQHKVDSWTFIGIHIVFVAILYFYTNFLNYHYMRRLKENGEELVDALVKM